MTAAARMVEERRNQIGVAYEFFPSAVPRDVCPVVGLGHLDGLVRFRLRKIKQKARAANPFCPSRLMEGGRPACAVSEFAEDCLQGGDAEIVAP